ncbi:hypothetical protein MKX01_005585 [Papaver californicum]|nr:hypothetical protein MKX01_005585 [Papaver californicum]
MDRKSEEFQSMGIFDIYREAYKGTMSWKNIFSQISISFHLPSTNRNSALDNAQGGNPNYNNLHSQVPSGLIIFYMFIAIFMLFTYVLTLLSISAIVYTESCVYSSKDRSFKKVMCGVPKV